MLTIIINDTIGDVVDIEEGDEADICHHRYPLWLPQVFKQALHRQCTFVGYIRSGTVS